MSKELEALCYLDDIAHGRKMDLDPHELKLIIEKALKALEIIKENLIVSIDEDSKDKPCLMVGVKINKDNVCVIYETFDRNKIDLLKEVLL